MGRGEKPDDGDSYITVAEKRCPRCGKTKKAADFPRNRARYDGLGAYCKSCSHEIQADWYERNKEAHIRNTSARKADVRKENRQRLREYFATRVCRVCGEDDPDVLRFHSRHAEDEASILQMVNDAFPWERIAAKLARCDILCANDYLRVTARERGRRRMVERWR